MRLEAQIKMGYYPTPDSVVDRIKSFIKFPNGTFTVLDPCCGCGTALARLVKDTNGLSYGIELDAKRYDEANKKLYKTAKGGYEIANVSNGSFSILFLNPPYDYSVEGERKEEIFLRDTYKYLKPGGLLIYIIPQIRLSKNIANILNYHFQSISVYRFMDDNGEYQEFKQIVIFAIKKKKGDMSGARNDLEILGLIGEELEQLPVIEKPIYTIPEAYEVKKFQSGVIDESELLKDVLKSTLLDKILPEPITNHLESPPLPLHTGHIGLLLASGYLDGVVDGCLVRGITEKTEIVMESDEENKTTIRESIKVKVRVLNPEGEVIDLI